MTQDLFRQQGFKVDRRQIILVAKKVYIYVSHLFISRMPKMRALHVNYKYILQCCGVGLLTFL